MKHFLKYLYDSTLLFVIKGNIQIHAIFWMTLESTVLSDRRVTQTATYLLGHCKKRQNCKRKKTDGCLGARGRGRGEWQSDLGEQFGVMECSLDVDVVMVSD